MGDSPIIGCQGRIIQILDQHPGMIQELQKNCRNSKSKVTQKSGFHCQISGK